MIKLARAAIAATALAASATAHAAEPVPEFRPHNIRPDIHTDEGGLWARSDDAERQVKASAQLDHDAQLTGYVRDVACKVATDYCNEIRIYVLDRPFFNASMAPNGYMEVWSGLLLRVDNESQLAFALGHETTHFVRNHSITSWRAAKTRSSVAMVVSLVAGGAGASVLGDLTYLGIMASVFSFTREQESEADRLGLQRSRQAGYDAAQGVDVFRNLQSEVAASQFEKVRKEDARTGFFDDHPNTAARLAKLSEELKTLPEGGIVEKEHYRAMIRPHLGEWLKDDLRRKDFGETLHLIDHLIGQGEDLGVLQFYKGEAYRLRRNDGDLDLARAAYELAIVQPDAPAAAWRELADADQALGQRDKARAAYETYLAKAPDADDRWLVEASLKKLSVGEHS
ncbi:MAG: M48 family metalloprotease [Ignavibacteriales bacterium]